jgi:hypothetical protein
MFLCLLLYTFVSDLVINEKRLVMDVLVIEPNSEDDFQLLVELAKKLGSKVVTLEKEEVEDIALLTLMNRLKTGEKVGREEVFDMLKS